MSFERRRDRVEALVVKDANSATGDKFVLGEETKSNILAVQNEYSYLNDFGTNVSISALTAPGQGSIIIAKQPNVSLSEKAGLAGYEKIDGTELDTISIAWGRPRFVRRGITAYDQDRGLVQSAAAFIAKAVEEGNQSRQLEGFKDLISEDTKKASNTLSAAVLSDAKQFRDRILTTASALLKTVNDKEGIKGIKAEDVQIQVSAEEAFKLLEIVGNQAMEQYENGLYKTMSFGGFSLRVNDLLARVEGAPKVVISTNFAYKSFHAIKGAKVELINGSFDSVIYYEDAIAQGTIYTGVTKVLY